MHKSGMISSACNDFFDAIFLAERFCTADKLDFDVVFTSKTLGACSDLVSHRLGEACEVENLDIVLIEIETHPVGMTPARNRAGDNDAVEARETARDLLGIAIL